MSGSKQKPNKKGSGVSQPQVGVVANAASAAAPILLNAAATIQQHHQGPLPAPEVLRQYDSIMPGLANRIIALAEQEAEHRRSIERSIVQAQVDDMMRYRRVEITGQFCGFLIGLFALGCAAYAGVHGAQWTGTFIGTSGVVGLVSAFILGRTLNMKQQREAAENARNQPPLQQGQLLPTKLVVDHQEKQAHLSGAEKK